MGHFADFAFSLASTALVLLFGAWVLKAIIAAVFHFRADYWRVFLALFAANVAFRFVVPMLFYSGIFGAHGNVPARMFAQLAVQYALFYGIHAGAVLLLVQDAEGRRIPTVAGLVTAAIPVAVSIAVTFGYILIAI